jgi:translation initiation factor 1
MSDDGLVYSTESGQICPKCSNPIKKCSCKDDKRSAVVGSGVVRVSRETKGRKGKGVTLVTGVPLNEIELKFLAKELKQKCGVGGTCKNGVIEIQGDQRDTIVNALIAKGYKAKRVGG